ncbi:Aconitase/3-isopropylmalate dehydratase large subunit, alpha/beta/alpha [Moorella glycerini]|uniref:Homoaconitase large subunit n=1 Tax=Neomoorella stamsii TaxID=1266720 RepID=A0A9X7J1K4_9FIRM|nr:MULTISPECIES: aconitase family protein [Moorella]PRR69947.1 Homoaconitase large subunit [Moorella stamsii]CEP68502.1 Aconitase/3-isopropylmalate dehydratase large subunit, alpha/beta/alpha [Moorella glycerini]
MNFLFKSLAAAAGKGQVAPGEEITINVDLILGHDGSAGKVLAVWPEGERVAYPERVVFTLDHTLPAPTVASRQLHQEMKAFARREGIHLFGRGEGVLHQVVAERFTPRAGMIIAGADGHVATAGAFGAIAFSLTPAELVPVLLTGQLQLTVPEVVIVTVEGNLPLGVSSRDLGLELLRRLGGGALKNKALLLQGEGVWQLSPSGRMSVCNLIGEMDGLTGLIVPPGEGVAVADLTIDAAAVESLVACPPAPANVHPLREMTGLPLTQVLVGGCGSGRLEDMEELAVGLGGKPVHQDITLLVVPASRAVLEEMEARGLGKDLREQGAIILPPGCGPCPGQHAGLLAPGDRALAATVRNTTGRMGSPEAEIYLASPRSAGLAAAAGAIAGG